MIQAFEQAGRASNVARWQGFTPARESLQAWIDNEPAKAGGWLLGPLVAVIIAGRPGASPIVT